MPLWPNRLVEFLITKMYNHYLTCNIINSNFVLLKIKPIVTLFSKKTKKGILWYCQHH